MMEAFSIGIRLSLVGNVGQGLLHLSAAFLKTDGQATKLQKKLDGIKNTAMKSGAIMGAGLAIAASFKPAIDEAVKLEQAVNRLKALNLGTANNQTLMRDAQKLSRSVKGMSIADAVQLTTETQSITGNVEETQMMLPKMATVRSALTSYMQKTGHAVDGEQMDGQFQALMKAAEMQGIIKQMRADPANASAIADNFLNLFTKDFVASGGTVKPSDILGMLKTAGVAGKQLDSDFMLAAGHLAQETGGSRLGTSLMSAYNNWQNGRTTQMSAEELVRLGLVDPSKVKYDTTGKMKGIKPDALVRSDVFMSNPLEYLNDYVLPALQNHGIDTSDKQKVLAELSTLFSNRTAGAVFSQMYLDREQLTSYMSQARGVKGYQDLYQQGAESTVGNLNDLEAKWNTLLASLGTTILPAVVSMTSTLVGWLQSLVDTINKHPGAAKWLVGLTAALAGFLTVAGSLGLIVSGMRALGLAMAFNAVGGFAGIVRVASAIGAFGKAMLFSEIGGPGGIVAATRSFGGAVTAFGVLSQAAAVFAAAYVGWQIGKQANHWIDKGVQAATGQRHDTLGGALYDLWNPYNSKTGHRESDKTPWGIASRLFSDDPLSRQAEMAGASGVTGRINPVATRANAAPVQMQTQINIDGKKVADVVTQYQHMGLTKPSTGTSFFDGSQYATSVATNYGQ